MPGDGSGPQARPAAGLPCLFETTEYRNPAAARISNSVAKKAETLHLNLKALIERVGIEHIGFVTLTFKENLCDAKEAQKRFHNLACNFLRHHVTEWITAVERQGRGAIHYHLVVVFPWNIREGFDFRAAIDAAQAKRDGDSSRMKQLERRYFASANADLRNWWRDLREAAASHGFGRCETLPVLSNASAIARYVGSYVTSEWRQRQIRDKGMRTIRYSLTARAASVRWAWADGNGRLWRRGCSILALLMGTDNLDEVLGNRWCWNFRESISAFGRQYQNCLAVLQQGISDHKTIDARVAACSRLTAYILTWERENAIPAKSAN